MNCWGNLKECCGGICDGLRFYLGGVIIFLRCFFMLCELEVRVDFFCYRGYDNRG